MEILLPKSGHYTMIVMIKLLRCLLAIIFVLSLSSKACELDPRYSYNFQSKVYWQVAKRLVPGFVSDLPANGREIIHFKAANGDEARVASELHKKVLGALLHLEKYLLGCEDQVADFLYELHNYKHHFKKFAEIKSEIQYIPGPNVTQSDLTSFSRTMKEIRHQFGASRDIEDTANHVVEITIEKLTSKKDGKEINFLRYNKSSLNKIHYTFETTSLLDGDLRALESVKVLTLSLVHHLPRRFHRDFNSPFAFMTQFIDRYYASDLEKKIKLVILIIFMIYMTIHFSKIKAAFLKRD